MNSLIKWFNILIKKRRELKRWQHVVTVLAAVITFATTYALILPAITVERDNTGDVGGMYLEQGADQDAMLEENALEPTDVTLDGDREDDAADPDAAGDEITAAPAVGTLKYYGSDYTVNLTYDETSEIPAGATLEVSEIQAVTDEYQKYLEKAKKAMGLSEEESLPRCAARFFDIKILAGGWEFTPKSGVSVEITYAEPLAEKFTYTFSVPQGNCPPKGSIEVTCNGEIKTADSSNDWTVAFEVAEDTPVNYSAAGDAKFVTDVSVAPASDGSEASGDTLVTLVPTPAELTRDVDINLSWGEYIPDAGTSVMVTFVPDKPGVESQTVPLGSDSWSASTVLPRLIIHVG